MKTKPYKHQQIEFDISKELESRALLWQMRTGKTKVIIDTACHLYTRGLIDTVCVFAPNGVHENWVDKELEKHHWDLPRRSIVFSAQIVNAPLRQSASQKQLGLARLWNNDFVESLSTNDLVWYAFNSESCASDSAKKLTARIYSRRKSILTVWDEVSDFRIPGSKRTKNARAVARKSAYRRILDGTLADNSPLNCFAPFELLEKEFFGFAKYSAFKNHYCNVTPVRMGHRVFNKITGYQNLDEMKAKIATKSSVILRNDCEDLPDTEIRNVEIELTEDQKRVYNEIVNREPVIIDDPIRLGKNKIIKLQQVASGYVKDKFGQIHRLKGINNKLERLFKEIDATEGKVIVICVFKEEIDLIKRNIKDTYLEYHGRTSKADKQHVRNTYNDGDEKVLISQCAAVSRGIDLSGASKIIWFSLTFNAVHYLQANERATKIGGQNIEIVHLLSGKVNKYILELLEKKISLGDEIAKSGLKKVIESLK